MPDDSNVCQDKSSDIDTDMIAAISLNGLYTWLQYAKLISISHARRKIGGRHTSNIGQF